MYADDIVLLSYRVCVLQKMIDICVDELNCIDLSFNVKNSCLLRFGPFVLRGLMFELCVNMLLLFRLTVSYSIGM